MKKLLVALLVSFGVSASAFAHCGVDHDAPVEVHDAWVRATVPQQRSTGAFMSLKAKENVRLLAASSPAARVVEVHEMAIGEDNVMRMRKVEAVELAAGEPLELKPGGYHIMLIDLVEQAREGTRVPLTLTLETGAGERVDVEVDAEVRALTQGAAGHSPAGKQAGHAH